jgi:Zn-dependent protease with chaperone function
MDAKELRSPKEKNLFFICFAFSLLTWIVLVVSLVGLFYGIFIGAFLFVAHALMIAHIKGNAVRLSREQLPNIYQRVVEAVEKLGLGEVPEVYLMQAGGMLNAFATKFVGRNFVVIYSDLLDACDEEGREMDMIIAHEIGHLALGHLKWLLFLTPARILPWIGAAYSRACEYSCDRCGMEVAGDLNAAARGLLILAAGGSSAQKVDINAFVKQTMDLGGFWASIYELNASHPFLPKRVAALVNWKHPGQIPLPKRSVMAYPLAPLLGAPVSGGAAAPLVIVAVIGILAAIAIPQYQTFLARAAEATATQGIEETLHKIQALAVDYSAQSGAWPCSIEELGAEAEALVAQQGLAEEMSCEDNYFALFYPKNGQSAYKVIYFESGEIQEGVIDPPPQDN